MFVKTARSADMTPLPTGSKVRRSDLMRFTSATRSVFLGMCSELAQSPHTGGAHYHRERNYQGKRNTLLLTPRQERSGQTIHCHHFNAFSGFQ